MACSSQYQATLAGQDAMACANNIATAIPGQELKAKAMPGATNTAAGNINRVPILPGYGIRNTKAASASRQPAGVLNVNNSSGNRTKPGPSKPCSFSPPMV